jgi:hypothetical protein
MISYVTSSNMGTKDQSAKAGCDRMGKAGGLGTNATLVFQKL